uniref:Uncharacterized protein n=1 Tax=Oreochromis aureus TaxID=47969 RepID=A0AAZ1X0Z8_OREAU
MKKHTMGIYVINKEDGQNGHYDDIGIFVEGEMVIDNIGSPAQACVLILEVIYALNLAYPKELKDYYEFIQKVLMGLDGKSSPQSSWAEELNCYWIGRECCYVNYQ